MLFSYYLCFPVTLALSTFLVACTAWKWFWWCVRPEKDFCSVLHLRKIDVVCSTRKCLGCMLTATERLILAVRSIWKRFGLVSNLRQIWAMCATWGRFLLEYSTWQRRFVVCSVLQRVWSCICSTLERVWLYVTSFVGIFFVGLFSLPAPAVTRREINTTPYNPS